MLKAYQSLLNVKTSAVGLGVVITGYWGRRSVVKTLMQYQFECELLQTFLEAVGTVLLLVYLLSIYYPPDTSRSLSQILRGHSALPTF